MKDGFGRRQIMKAGAGALLSTLVTRWLDTSQTNEFMRQVLAALTP